MKKNCRLTIANAIIWAALMLATALIFTTAGADAADSYGYLLTVIMIPLWIASDQVIRRAMRKSEV